MARDPQPSQDESDDGIDGTGPESTTPPNASMDVAPELFVRGHRESEREDSPP